MYRTIMVPTDCSGFDREAIRVALRLAERGDGKIHLVRVLSMGPIVRVGAGDSVAMTAEAIRVEHDAALSELNALAGECRANTRAEVAVSLEHGPTADALAGYANRHAVDLIVISSHGRGGISRLSLGSVTDSLIRLTAIPVLVVKPAASYLNPQVAKPFSRIVVPLDGSGLAERILPKVATLAEAEGSELTLLHVLIPHTEPETARRPGRPWWDREVARAQAYLSRRARDVAGKTLAVKTEVVVGENVADEITSFARGISADLIAIATHGRGGLSRVLRGSVADAVTRSAWSSTLIFHPDKTLEHANAPDGALAALNPIPA